jgi:hypothetical protein
MQWYRNVARPMARVVLVAFATVFTVSPAAHAAMVGTDQLVSAHALNAEQQQLTAFLQREDVRQQLHAMGVDAREAERRVAALTPAETQRLAAEMDQLPKGGADLVGAILFIFLLLLLTDLLGLTDVYPFVKKHRR